MAHLLIAIISSVALIVTAIFARIPNYHIAPAFLVPVVWGVYLLKKKLHLQPINYAHPDTMYFFDTQRDLTNNLLGTLTALAGIAMKKLFWQ